MTTTTMIKSNKKDDPFPFVIGVLNIVFGALYGLLGLVGLIFGLIAIRAMSGGGSFVESLPGLNLIVQSGMVLFILWAFLGTLDRVLQIISGVGLVMKKKWAGTVAIIFGAYRIITRLIHLGWLVVVAITSNSLGGGIAVIPFLFVIISIVYGVMNIIAGVRFGKGAISKKADLPFQIEPTPIKPPGPIGLPITDDPTRAYPGAIKKISAQVIVNGKVQREITLQVRDVLGKPIRNTIGRSAQCEVQIPLPSVSNEHCCITEDTGGNMIVRDLGSTHGTFIERSGRTLRVERPMGLFNGDIVMLGPYAQLILHEITPSVRGVRV